MPQDPEPTPDRRVAALAAGQDGSLTQRQMRAAGLTDFQIRGRLTRGTLERTGLRGVYRLAGAPRSWRQDLRVALLAAPPGAVASHESAAALFDLRPPPQRPQVSVPRTSSGRFGGATVHRSDVPPEDTCTVASFRCTTPARLLVECAAVLDQQAVDNLVDVAVGSRLTTVARVAAARSRFGQRCAGAARLDAALAPYRAGARPESPAEARALRCFQRWGLPAPVCQFVIRDEKGRFVARVDFVWPERRFGLEYNGDQWHSPRAWQRDHAREDRIEALGWRIEAADREDLRPSATRLRNLLHDVLRRTA